MVGLPSGTTSSCIAICSVSRFAGEKSPKAMPAASLNFPASFNCKSNLSTRYGSSCVSSKNRMRPRVFISYGVPSMEAITLKFPPVSMPVACPGYSAVVAASSTYDVFWNTAFVKDAIVSGSGLEPPKQETGIGPWNVAKPQNWFIAVCSAVTSLNPTNIFGLRRIKW